MDDHLNGHTLDWEVGLDVTSIEPQKATAAHLVVRIQARDDAVPVEDSRPPLAVVFALDCSGSMGGHPIEQVISSTESLIRMLDMTDRAAIVAFSDTARLVAPLERLDDVTRARLVRNVQNLRAGGNTNIEDGLRKALALFGAGADGERRVVLLLSDGEPNRGATSADDLGRIAGTERSGASISALGYGPHHHEDILTAIQRAGGGLYHYVQDPQVCHHELALALGAQADVVAEGLHLILAPIGGTVVRRVLGGARMQLDSRGAVVPLPDIIARSSQVAVVEVSLQPGRELGRWHPLEVSLCYRKPGEKKERTLTHVVDAAVAQNGGAPIPARHAMVLLALAEEARREARAMADGGHFEAAAAHLRRFIERLDLAPDAIAAPGTPLAEAREQIRDEAALYERKPSAEHYQSSRRATLSSDFTSSRSYLATVPEAFSAISRRFTASAVGRLVTACLVLIDGKDAGRRIPLNADQVIGRTETADVRLDATGVSRRHAEILVQGGDFLIRDLASLNGTAVNGERLGDVARVLADGDVIAFGGAVKAVFARVAA